MPWKYLWDSYGLIENSLFLEERRPVYTCSFEFINLYTIDLLILWNVKSNHYETGIGFKYQFLCQASI